MTGAFDGKIAIVTGGTQGLGETTARLFAERGAAGLVIVGRNAEHGEAVAKDISDGGCRTLFVKADLGNIDACRLIVPRADEIFGRVDVLVNAAAITDRGTILDTSPDLFDRMFAINARAPFFLIQDVAKVMIRERIEGAVVNIISVSSHGGQPFISAYCASKAALAVITKNAAYALMRNRIRINGLNLGWMDTPGEHRIQTVYHGGDENWLEKAEAEQPFGRILKTAEVTRAVAFLASAESGMMTGSVIDFDQSVIGCFDSAPHPVAPMTV